MLRTLPVVVHPGPDETWHSWLTRLAHTTRTDPRTLLNAIGYWPDTDRHHTYHGYGLTLPDPHAATRIAAATRQHPNQVTGMMLNAFNLGPLHLGPDDLAGHGLRRWALFTWVHLGTSTACPACLTETNYQWKLTWRLPWTYACTRHRLLHNSTCPGCGQPLNAGSRRDHRLGPPSNRIPHPAHCSTPLPEYRNPNPPLCNHPHTELPHQPLYHAALLTTQQNLDLLLTPEHRTSHPDWWTDLRTITSLLLAHANTAAIGDLYESHLPDTLIDAITGHYDTRDHVDAQRAETITRTGDHRRANRQRTHTATPTNLALLAAILPIATAALHHLQRTPQPIADLPSGLPPEDAWTLLTDTLTERGRNTITELRQRQASTELITAAANITARRNRLQLTHSTPPAIPTAAIPRLWPWHFYEPIRHLFTGTTEDYARSYLSLAAAKLVTGGTWHTAADALQWDRKTARKCANAVTTRLTANGTYQQVHEHLAATIADLDPTIDYRQLAQHHAHHTTVAKAEWRRVCERASVSLWGTQARRRNYAAYQWHTVALMPLNEWPGWETCDNPDNAKEVYRRFVARDVPQVHPD